MLRTVQFACSLPKDEADALNRESGRIYSDMLTRHYRLYRKQGVWLAPVAVRLPNNLLALQKATFLEARLVWDRAARHYAWHVVVEDGTVYGRTRPCAATSSKVSSPVRGQA